jgi:hypothetical protein
MDAEEVKELLAVQELPGTPRQIARLCRWIESMVANFGRDYVQWNRHLLIKEWEECTKTAFTSCI